MATTSTTIKCLNDPNIFCYICGNYTLKDQKVNINNTVKEIYLAYFKVHVADQDKIWAPHIACKTCVTTLRSWTQGKRNLQFGVPMVWKEPTNHFDNCYFCLVNVKGFTKKTKQFIKYPDIPSAIRPVPHCKEIPVPVCDRLPEIDDDLISETSSVTSSSDSTVEPTDIYVPPREYSITPSLFSQAELNDLVRDLNLPKVSAKLLASRLNEKRMLEPGTSISFYRNREAKLRKYFKSDAQLLYCSDVKGLLLAMGLSMYDASEWRLFIDSSKRSLKCVLLHTGNKFGSIPIGYSVNMKDEYASIKIVLEKLQYHVHKWLICVDVKMVNLLLGQQGGFTKYPCFLCCWDSRAREDHWAKKEWPPRKVITSDKNIINDPLVPRKKIIFSSLHIKLGLMKQFVKSLDQNGDCFNHIRSTFPNLSEDKKKEGIFDGPQIRTLLTDAEFVTTMNAKEARAWNALSDVIKNFLGNDKADNYHEIVEELLLSFQSLGCKMGIKLHYLHSHLSDFSENLGDVSEEQGERFHQDIKMMQERYQGKWDCRIMADYCWSLKRDAPHRMHHRMSKKRKSMYL